MSCSPELWYLGFQMSSNHCQTNGMCEPVSFSDQPNDFPTTYPFDCTFNLAPRRIPQCWTAGHQCCLPDVSTYQPASAVWGIDGTRIPRPLWWALHLFSWKRCSPKMRLRNTGVFGWSKISVESVAIVFLREHVHYNNMTNDQQVATGDPQICRKCHIWNLKETMV